MAKKKNPVQKKSNVSKTEKSKSEDFVNKEMLIGEAVNKYPEIVEIMFKHGMHCIGCGMTAYESIEQGCMGHGLDEKDVDEMVKEMNLLLKKKQKQ
jgi:hybrid cluster-associated redox disulfide protein